MATFFNQPLPRSLLAAALLLLTFYHVYAIMLNRIRGRYIVHVLLYQEGEFVCTDRFF